MDATWSVRMPEEMKEKLSAMITESGLNAKDFIAQIMQAYELNMAKRVQPMIAADVEELSLLTGRVHSLFVNLCERVTNFQQQREEDFEGKLAEKDGMLSIFNDRIRVQEEQLSQHKQDKAILKKEYEDLYQQHIQAVEMCETNKALVMEYREKNDTLTGLLGEYKELRQLSESLKQKLDEEKKLYHTAQFKLLEKEKETEGLKDLLEEQRKAAQLHLEQRLELADIAKEKEILTLQKEHHKALDTLQQQYANKTRELLEIIEEHQKTKAPKKPSTRPVLEEA